MLTFFISCTKGSAMKDEHMDAKPCINIMVQWFQEGWKLTSKISKFWNIIRYSSNPSGLNLSELPEMRKTKELWANLFTLAENN